MKALREDRKKTILIILLLLFAVTLGFRILHPYRQGRVDTLTYTEKKSGVAVKNENREESSRNPRDRKVRLDLIENPPLHSGAVLNNIFFRERKGPEEKEIPFPPSSHFDRKPVTPVSPLEQKRAKVREDLSGLKAFGYLESGGVKTLFLEKGRDILLVKRGDRIEGRYLVKEITQRKITLRAEEINEDIHIDLGQF